MSEQQPLTIAEELQRLAIGLESSSKQLTAMSDYLSRVSDLVRKGVETAATPTTPQVGQVELEASMALNNIYGKHLLDMVSIMRLPMETTIDEVFIHAKGLLSGMFNDVPTVAQEAPLPEPVVTPAEPEVSMPTPISSEESQKEKLMAAIMKDWHLGILRTYLSPATWPVGQGVVRHREGVLDKHREDVFSVDFYNLFRWPVGFYVDANNGNTQMMLRDDDIALLFGDTMTLKTLPLAVVRQKAEGGDDTYIAKRLDVLEPHEYEAAHAMANRVLMELTSKM